MDDVMVDFYIIINRQIAFCTECDKKIDCESVNHKWAKAES